MKPQSKVSFFRHATSVLTIAALGISSAALWGAPAAPPAALTPEQISKLKAMQLDLNRTQARTEADIKIAKLELQAILEDEKAEFSTIQAKVDQLKKAEGALLLVADHAAYHVGQLVAVRRALGIWP